MLSSFKRGEGKRLCYLLCCMLPLSISYPVRLHLCRVSAGLGVLASLIAPWGPHHDLIILTDHSMQRAVESSGVCF